MQEESRMQNVSRAGKKGQITIFIIVGIVMLVAVALFVVLRFTGPEESLELNVGAVESFVEECLEKSATDGIKLMAGQGGYILLPEEYIDTNYSDVPYLYDEGAILTLSRKQLSEELDSYVNEFVPLCLNNLNAFKDQFDVVIGKPNASSLINDDNVIMNLQYPVIVSSGDISRELSKFNTKINVPIGKDFDIVNTIVASIADNPNYIDMTLLQEFDVNVTLLPYDENSFLYGIEDPFVIFGDENFKILFAARFK
ncbi:MAG: hypothetical protein U9R08_00740 [Nanoarchaeota archaeon]|nr:hypothetical protein [Nanoarchaeota archaeon]